MPRTRNSASGGIGPPPRKSAGPVLDVQLARSPREGTDDGPRDGPRGRGDGVVGLATSIFPELDWANSLGAQSPPHGDTEKLRAEMQTAALVYADARIRAVEEMMARATEWRESAAAAQPDGDQRDALEAIVRALFSVVGGRVPLTPHVLTDPDAASLWTRRVLREHYEICRAEQSSYVPLPPQGGLSRETEMELVTCMKRVNGLLQRQ